MSASERDGSGLAAMGGDGIETHVPGDPAAFHALATFLRGCLADRIEALAAEAVGHRRRLADGWRGEAGMAFGVSLGRLVGACDQVAADVEAAAAQVDTLGDTLHATQSGLAALRGLAPSRGMEVVGTRILPGRLNDPLLAPMPDLRDFTAASTVWNETRSAAEDLWRRWYDAVNESGGWVSEHASLLATLLASLGSATAARQPGQRHRVRTRAPHQGDAAQAGRLAGRRGTSPQRRRGPPPGLHRPHRRPVRDRLPP